MRILITFKGNGQPVVWIFEIHAHFHFNEHYVCLLFLRASALHLNKNMTCHTSLLLSESAAPTESIAAREFGYEGH